MFARVTTLNVQKDKIEALEKRLKEVTWPGTKEQKGYKGYLALMNRETGEGIVIAIFDTEANMLASQKAAYYESATNKDNLATFGVKFNSIKSYSVGIKD